MEKINQHIAAFSELMTAKGYTNYFHTCADNPGKLKESLDGHIRDLMANQSPLNEFSLTLFTHSDWKDDNSDYTNCNFQVDYSEKQGFQVKKLDIERKNTYGNPGSSQTISFKDNLEIPSRVCANLLVNPRLENHIRIKPKRLKMRCILIFILCTLFAQNGSAQNFSEWFNQKATQKKYLIQQIAALQVYIGYAKKGYKIADQGLKTIGKWSKGEFDLHSAYINSLNQVNPKVKSNPKVNDILEIHQTIIQEYHSTYNHMLNSEMFNSEELAYFRRVYDRLLNNCTQQLDQLNTVLSDHQFQMKDDERLGEINHILEGMLDNYNFAKNFSKDAKTMARMRYQQKREVEHSRALQGILNL